MLTEEASEDTQNNADVSAQTKYMQQYRTLSKPYVNIKNLLTIQNFYGKTEFFVPDAGGVWNYYPDPSDSSGSGYGVEKLKFKWDADEKDSMSIAIGTDSDNKIVVFAARGNKLQYIRESRAGGDQRWEKAANASYLDNEELGELDDLTQISQVYTRKIDGSLYVGALRREKKKPLSAISYQLAYSVWKTDPAPFTLNTETIWAPVMTSWTGSSKEEAAFSVLRNDTYRSYLFSKDEWTPKANIEKSDVQLIATAGNEVFFLTRDGKLCMLYQDVSDEIDEYHWRIIDDGNYDFLQAVIDNDNVIHLFMRSRNNIISYCHSMGSSLSWSAPETLAVDVETISVIYNQVKNQITLFSISGINKKSGIITEKIYEIVSDNLKINLLLLQNNLLMLPMRATDAIDEFFAYSTDVAVTDQNGSPLADFKISITSSPPTKIIINNKPYLINDNNPTIVSTDYSGMLNIVQPAEVLGTAAVLQLDSTKFKKGAHVLRPWMTTVLPKLKAATAESLKTQMLPDGTYLLPERIRKNEAEVSKLAEHIAACVGLLEKANVVVAADHSVAGFIPVPSGSVMRFNRIVADSSYVGMNTSRFSPEVQQMPNINQLTKTSDSGGWKGDFSELLAAAMFDDTLSTDIKIDKPAIITALKPSLNGYIDLIKKGVEHVKYVFNFLIETVNDAFHAVQAFFVSAGVTIQKTQQWLGEIFEWKDILRTKEALAHMIEQVLTFSERAVKEIGSEVVKQCTDWQKQEKIDDVFDKMKNKFPGNLKQEFYEKTPQGNSQEIHVISNNPLYRAVLDHTENATIKNVPESDSEIGDNLAKILKKFENEGNRYAKSISTLGSPADMYNLALPNLFDFLKIVASGTMDIVKSSMTELLKVVHGTISNFKALLNAEWHIPFVSPLYRYMTSLDSNMNSDGAKLNAKNLIALIIAIPATTAWKVARQEAIFKDDDKLDEFKKEFTWENMFKFFPETQISNENVRVKRSAEIDNIWKNIRKHWGDFLGFISGFTGGISIILTGIAAHISKFTDHVKGARLCAALSVVAFCLSMSNFSAERNGWPIWVLALVAFIIDVIMVCFSEEKKENTYFGFLMKTTAPIITTIVGILLLMCTGKAIYEGEISNDMDIIIALTYPIAATLSFLTIEEVEFPPKMTLIFSAITVLLGTTCISAAGISLKRRF